MFEKIKEFFTGKSVNEAEISPVSYQLSPKHMAVRLQMADMGQHWYIVYSEEGFGEDEAGHWFIPDDSKWTVDQIDPRGFMVDGHQFEIMSEPVEIHEESAQE